MDVIAKRSPAFSRGDAGRAFLTFVGSKPKLCIDSKGAAIMVSVFVAVEVVLVALVGGMNGPESRRSVDAKSINERTVEPRKEAATTSLPTALIGEADLRTERYTITKCPTARRLVKGCIEPVCICHHLGAGTHFRTRANAEVRMTDNGLIHVVEPCGGEPQPDVLWYVLKLGQQGTNCGTPAPPQTAPYRTGPIPNPNNPSTVDPSYDNVTRHWPIGGTVQYTVWAPSAYPLVFPLATPSNPATYAPAFTSISYPNGYSYSNLNLDVTTILNYFCGLPWVNLSCQNNPYPTPAPNYDPYTAAPNGQTLVNLFVPGIAGGKLVWDICHLNPPGTLGSPPNAGPTGNGLNEIIFLQNVNMAPFFGLTSMLVDPHTGQIVEADVILEANEPYPGAVVPGKVWTQSNYGPRGVTGLIHELGHFLGLDHTNIHPGFRFTPAFGQTGGVPNLVPAPISTQTSTFPGTLAAAGFASLSPSRLPAMVTNYTVQNYFQNIPDTDYVTAYTSAYAPGTGYPLALIANPYADDIAGLSKIYPSHRLLANGKRPISFDCAQITGSAVDANGAAVFGRNVLLELSSGGGFTVTNGGLSGSARFSPGTPSVVGKIDTATNAGTSGEYRIEGVFAHPSFFWTQSGPDEVAVYCEPMECIGLTSASFAEWWNTGLPFSGTFPYVNAITPPPSTTFYQSGWKSNSFAGIGGHGTLPVGSLAVVPGTVLALPPLADGTGVQILNVSRPLIEIVRPAPTLPLPTTLTVNVFHNYPWPFIPPGPIVPNITCTINGLSVQPAVISVNGSVSQIPGAYLTVVSVTIPSGLAQPTTVSVSALESFGVITFPPPPPPVQGYARLEL